MTTRRYQYTSSKQQQISVEDVRFRRALLSDFDTIMAFGDVYEGRDYLWALYNEFVTEPDNYCIVAVLNGVVVGYGMSSIIDGGLTGVARTGRISPEFRGQGIFKMLQDEIERQCHPEALYITFNTISKEDEVKSIKPIKPGDRPVHNCETRTMSFKLSKEYPDQVSSSTSQIDVRRLGYQDLKLLFATKDVSSKLFPSQRLFHFLMGYRLMEANIRHFLCQRSGVFVTLNQKEHSDFSLFQQGLHHTGRLVSRPKGGKSFSRSIKGTQDSDKHCQLDFESVRRVAMLTKYFCYPTKSNGFSVFLDIYVRSGDPIEHLKVHLLNVKKDMQCRFPGQDGQVIITYEAPLSSNHIVSCFADVGIGHLVPNGEKRAVLWERPRREIMSKL